MNERIKMLRHTLGLTQQEFANKIGVKRNTITNYEIGRNDPVDSVVSLICREFNVSEKWLRTGEGKMFIPNPDTELDALCSRYGLNSGSRAFIKEFAELSEGERKAILKYIQKVAAALREEDVEDLTEEKIQSEGEDYKRQLREEKEAAEESGASHAGKGA